MADKGIELTDKNRTFIYKLVHGKSESGNALTVYEAYQQSGYSGDIHAAYQLKSRLEKELMLEEINKGASKADIFKQIADMMQLPAVDKAGNAVNGISLTNKIKVLGLALKAHEQMEPQPKRLTAFQINFPGNKPQEAMVVEAEVVEQKEKGE